MERFVPFRLPAALRLGCATAATQIEGGGTDNSWYDWAKRKGKIRDGSTPARANRHWERYEQDILLMARLGMQCYRMGIEWSRIEPEPGRFCAQAMDHYRDEIRLLLRHGIRPLVTLHHFSNPTWFERTGGFLRRDCVPVFLRYVRYAAEHLKDLCCEYVTINEPNVYAANGFFYGSWPPGRHNFFAAMRVMRNLSLCHLAAYREIHRIYGKKRVMVGFANHLRVFEPYSKNPVYAAEAALMRYLFQDIVTEAMCTGNFRFPLGRGAPAGTGRFYDYIGINYYTRSSVRHFRGDTLRGRETNDLGWDIYPEGLELLCREQYEKYRAPIWITENGTCDRTDRFRAQYIYSHLRWIAKSRLPVERYYHWTFLDNFEWAEGESAPFGLVRCDFETQERTVRRSGLFYSELIRAHGVTADMIRRYLAGRPNPPPSAPQEKGPDF